VRSIVLIEGDKVNRRVKPIVIVEMEAAASSWVGTGKVCVKVGRLHAPVQSCQDLRDDRRERIGSVAVPEALSGYAVESANAEDYDRLLGRAGGGGA
jgi:hypothetical protein